MPENFAELEEQCARRKFDIQKFQNQQSRKMSSCPLCTKVFQCKSSLNCHMVSHTKEKAHKCQICSSAFGTNDSLKAHIKSVHDGIKRIKKKNTQCSLCSYKCYDKTMLRVHLRTHSAVRPFSCSIPGCGFKTKYAYSLQHHVRGVHRNERPYECPSEGCNYKAIYKQNLKQHLKIHSNEKPFACEVQGCNYRGKLKDRLKEHFSRAHRDEKPFKCSSCDYRGKRKSDLVRHMHKHEQVKRFQCQVRNCGFSSHRKGQLKLHNDHKHRQKNYLCTAPRCNFRSGAITYLEKHLRRHQNPLLKCPSDSCNYSTSFKGSLLSHISRRHKGFQSPVNVLPSVPDLVISATAGAFEKLQCPYQNCGYETTFPHRYDRHRITHIEEEKRKLVCVFCLSRFSSLYRLTCHLASHTGEKPYRCSFCEYMTGCSHYLRLHGLRTHRINVIPCGKENEVRKCRTCNMIFWSNTELVLHSMSHLQPIVILEQLKLQNL